MYPLEKTVAFSGNRVITLGGGDSCAESIELLRDSLRSLIGSLYECGKRYFIVGGALGFDMLAAEVLLELRAEYSELELIVAIPFVGQQAKYSSIDKERYDSILCEADHIEVISDDGFSMAAYHARNDFMVTSSSLLVAYSNGRGRGTLSTMRRAKSLGVTVINLYDELFAAESNSQLALDFR